VVGVPAAVEGAAVAPEDPLHPTRVSASATPSAAVLVVDHFIVGSSVQTYLVADAALRPTQDTI
jgi:hypothetical protein